MKLYLDPGHGGSDPGAGGNGLKEKDVVLDIAHRIREILLNDYENVEVKMSRTNDSFKSLDKRTNEANAWGADYYLSIHCNAANSTASGYEDFIYNRLSNASIADKYQDIVHEEIMKVNQLKDRGHKKANFHVLRETSMPALLTENGYIDNEHDASLMKDSSWLQMVAEGHVNGLKRIFKLQRKMTNSETKSEIKSETKTETKSEINPKTMHKVIAGSFESKENAEKRVVYLRSKSIESFIATIRISDKLWYRVQVEGFVNRENAEKSLAEVIHVGIKDAFIVAEDFHS